MKSCRPHMGCSHLVGLVYALLGISATAFASAGTFIVQDGKPNAEIVVAVTPSRSVKLAAQELQTYLAKISGATLNIVSEPTENAAVKIYVGRSPGTDRLNVKGDELQFDAFRMASGETWLALVGDDTNFIPREPWARSRGDWTNNVIHKWDKLTGAYWQNPIGGDTWKYYDKALDLWYYDHRGSLNAVYAFLRSLGVRWYMPGELGEIVPKMATIELPRLDRTVVPDFEYRTVGFDRYFTGNVDGILYALRLGVNGICAPMHHGLRSLLSRPEQKAAHPEYYRIVNGKPDTEGRAQACLSSEAFLQETVRFARTLFDLYDFPIVSVMPEDGFTAICQCPQCSPQATLDRDSSGWYSDYVWSYVCRVANEVAKTHPDRKIICGAYSTYQLPPLKLNKLPRNVLVQITNGMPRSETDAETREQLADLRAAWAAKTDNKLSISMNYPFTQRGEYRPQYFPHVISQALRDIKGQVWRLDLWIPERKGSLHEPGVNHLNAYLLGSLMWDADQDVDAVLSEYYDLFYGPAEKEMKAFIEYCEANYEKLNKDKDTMNSALDLFDAVKTKVAADSVYGRRIALVDDYLGTFRNRRDQLSVGRGPVPEFSAWELDNRKWDKARQDFKLDGKLDEPFWNLRGGLKDLVTGEKAKLGTKFQILTSRDAIYFGIRCQEAPGEAPLVSATKSGDPAIWNGDHVEIMIETDAHSYYQIVLDPAGAVMDLDREGGKPGYDWESNAQVGAYVGDGFWSLELRLPIVSRTDDPLHDIIGHGPTADLPWYFNVCRKRVRGKEVEVTAFSPTGERTFQDVMKFGKLQIKPRSERKPAAASGTDPE